MSKQLSKGDLIINPKTQRPIKIGGRIYTKLVREGILQKEEYKDDNELYTLQEGDDVKEKIEEINKTLPRNVQSVRGRGKYKNKIVKRHKQPSTIDTSRHTVKTTAKKLKNRGIYDELQSGGNFEEDLEKLIMSELANCTVSDSERLRESGLCPSEELDSESDFDIDFESTDDEGEVSNDLGSSLMF